MSVIRLTDEDVHAAKIERQVMQEYGEGIRLLAHLACQSTVEAGRATEDAKFGEPFGNVHVAFIALQLGASWSAIRLIRTGYPKEALVFARTIREGHIAFVWSATFPKKCEARFPAPVRLYYVENGESETW